MGRKVVLVLLSWLAAAAGEEQKAVNSSLVSDNVSAESAPQLYPEGFKVYASGAPYSLTFLAPDTSRAASHIVPVKEESVFINNQNGFLKDSYGNQYKVGSPQAVAYRTTFPQQYVRLQDLPVHLSQPLVPGFNYNGNGPQFSYKAPTFRFSTLSVTPTPIVRSEIPSHGYASNTRGVSPLSVGYSVPHGSPLQQPSNSKAVYANHHNTGYYNPQQEPKFQRLKEIHPHGFQISQGSGNLQNQKVIYSNKQNLQQALGGGIQGAPAKQVTVRTYNNGKKATVTLQTQPVLPLLDLNLLQPLHFDNPIVPQVQHYLPKINYPIPQVEQEQHNNVYVVQNTKSYESGPVPQSDVVDDNEEEEEGEDDGSEEEEEAPPPPKQSKKLIPTQKPQHNLKPSKNSYEINSPNYKETYNEQVIKYDKKTESDPVHHSYNKQTENKPVTYSYTKSSKAPVIDKHHSYEVHGKGPNQQIIIHSTPESTHHHHHQEQHHEHHPQSNHREHQHHPHRDHQGDRHHHSQGTHQAQHHPQTHHHQELLGHPQSKYQGEHHHPHPNSNHHEERHHHQGDHHHHHPQSSLQGNHHGQTHHPQSHYQGEHHSNINNHHEERHHHPQSHIQGGHHHHHPQNHHQGPPHPHPQSSRQEAPPRQQPQGESEESGESQSEESDELSPRDHSGEEEQDDEEIPSHQLKAEHREQQNGAPQRSAQQHSVPHNDIPQHHAPHRSSNYNAPHRNAPQHNTPHFNVPQQVISNVQSQYGFLHSSPPPQFHPIVTTIQSITPEYEEENIRIVPADHPSDNGQINREPPHHQHNVPYGEHEQQNHNSPGVVYQDGFNGQIQVHPQIPQSSPSPQIHYTTHRIPAQHVSSPQPRQYQSTHPPQQEHHESPSPSPQSFYGNSPHVIEKSRKIIIQEETPDEMHMLSEQMVAEMINQGEENEEDFEKAYKEAAFGFPAYERNTELEKDIYNADSYGAPKYKEEDGFEHSPFQQYQEQGDEFPKNARLTYKGDKDNLKEDYFLDYSVHQPESYLDMHKSKVGYYKMFKKQKPKYYFGLAPEKKHQNSEKKLAADLFGYNTYQKPKQISYFAKLKQPPNFEYNYAKETPKDNFAYASSGPIKTKTLFVEPQFQYGFEPSSLPRLLDSELSAMATNHSPESEKPGTRKKIYKETFHIKKTSTASEPAR